MKTAIRIQKKEDTLNLKYSILLFQLLYTNNSIIQFWQFIVSDTHMLENAFLIITTRIKDDSSQTGCIHGQNRCSVFILRRCTLTSKYIVY